LIGGRIKLSCELQMVGSRMRKYGGTGCGGGGVIVERQSLGMMLSPDARANRNDVLLALALVGNS
jgi:hypothetical protein